MWPAVVPDPGSRTVGSGAWGLARPRLGARTGWLGLQGRNHGEPFLKLFLCPRLRALLHHSVFTTLRLVVVSPPITWAEIEAPGRINNVPLGHTWAGSSEKPNCHRNYGRRPKGLHNQDPGVGTEVPGHPGACGDESARVDPVV